MISMSCCLPFRAIGFLCLLTICILANQARAEAAESDTWHRHRGDAALQGKSTATLGDKLVLDWIFDTGDFLKSSVIASNTHAYIGSDLGVLHAIALQDGKEHWQFKAEMSIEAPPLLVENILYVGSTDSFLYAIDSRSGELLWKYETDGEIMGAANQAIRPKSKDSVIVVGSYDNFVHCLDAKTGKLLWKFETQNYVNGVPTIFDQQYVVFGGCDSMLYVIHLEDGSEVRAVEVEAPIAASVAVADGVGYVGNMDRAVMAFKLLTGEQVWSYQPKGFPYFSSPAINEDTVFIGGRDKGLHAIDRLSGKQKWRFSSRGRIDSSPVITDEKVVFGSMDGKLYLLAMDSGKEIASYEIGESISSTPAILNGKIIVGCEDGKVYASQTENKK